jgi:hypothetical protein
LQTLRMKRIRIIGLAVAAMFALSALGASAASAVEPEYILANESLTKFTSSQIGASSILENTAKTQVSCTGQTGKGEVTPKTNKASKIVVTFTGCASGVTKCQTKGLAEGTIETKALKGELGYIKKEPTKEVGLDLEPETGTEFANFECGSKFLTNNATGSVDGRIEPINTPTTSFTVKFKCPTSGMQEITSLEIGGLKDSEDFLTSELLGTKARSCEIAESSVKPETTVTIKA